MKTLMRNGRDRRSENPFLDAKKERVSLFGTDQRITSGPAARRPHSKAEYSSFEMPSCQFRPAVPATGARQGSRLYSPFNDVDLIASIRRKCRLDVLDRRLKLACG